MTVAAATGSVVASLLASNGISHLKEAFFSPSGIVFTILMTIVSVTLIGPIEEYVFELRIAAPVVPFMADVHGHGPGENRLDRIVRLASPLAFVRLLLVLVFWMLITGLHGALDETFRSGNTVETLIIVLSSGEPAVVTYFWCAALQRRVKSVARRAGLASAGCRHIAPWLALLAVFNWPYRAVLERR